MQAATAATLVPPAANHMTTLVGGKQNILEIEKSLGIWWPRGLSRQKDGRKIPAVAKLLKEFERITQAFGCLSQREIRHSNALRDEATATFLALGHEIWPNPGQDRSAWLVTDAATNDLGGLYPHNLYFSDPEDRRKLHDLFQELVVAKCIRYYENHGRHWHYELDQASDSDAYLEVNNTNTALGANRGMSEPGHGVDRAGEGVSRAGAPGLSSRTPSQSISTRLINAQLQGPPPLPFAQPLNTVPLRLESKNLCTSEALPKRSPAPTSPRPPKRTKLPDREATTDSHDLSTASNYIVNNSADEASIQNASGPPKSSIAQEILGDLVDSPSVVKILANRHSDSISREHWIVLKRVLLSQPAAREDSNLLHAELSRIEMNPSAPDRTVSLTASARAMTTPASNDSKHSTRGSSGFLDRRGPGENVILSMKRPSMAAAPPSIRSPTFDVTRPVTHSAQHFSHGGMVKAPPRQARSLTANSVPSMPKMNIWLRPKDTLGRSAIMLDKPVDVVEIFRMAQKRLARKLNGRAVAALTFTHMGRFTEEDPIEDDPIEVEARDQTTWEALLSMVLLFPGPEPIELRAIVEF